MNSIPSTMDFFKEAEQKFKLFADHNRLSHFYLFFGEDQQEIFVFAQSLANFLERGEFKKPDKLLQDLFIIVPNAKGNIGIDEARAIKNFLHSRPAVSKKRTVIIYGFENLTLEAQSAILKSIEEPPKEAFIILIGRALDNLLATVTSRAQKIYFPPRHYLETEARTARNSRRKKNSDDWNKKESDKNGDEQIEKLRGLIAELKKDPKKNLNILKEALNRLSLIESLNLNKKLQIRVVESFLKNYKR